MREEKKERGGTVPNPNSEEGGGEGTSFITMEKKGERAVAAKKEGKGRFFFFCRPFPRKKKKKGAKKCNPNIKKKKGKGKKKPDFVQLTLGLSWKKKKKEPIRKMSKRRREGKGGLVRPFFLVWLFKGKKGGDPGREPRGEGGGIL